MEREGSKEDNQRWGRRRGLQKEKKCGTWVRRKKSERSGGKVDTKSTKHTGQQVKAKMKIVEDQGTKNREGYCRKEEALHSKGCQAAMD